MCEVLSGILPAPKTTIWYSLLHTVVSRTPAWSAMSPKFEPLRHGAQCRTVLLLMSSPECSTPNSFALEDWFSQRISCSHKSLKYMGDSQWGGGVGGNGRQGLLDEAGLQRREGRYLRNGDWRRDLTRWSSSASDVRCRRHGWNYEHGDRQKVLERK